MMKVNRKVTYYIAGQPLVPFLSTKAEPLSTRARGLSTRAEIPEKLLYRIRQLGSRTSNPKEVEQIIIELYDYKEYTLTEIATILGRNEKYVKNNYLKKLIKIRKIGYIIPKMISHPNQKYKAARIS